MKRLIVILGIACAFSASAPNAQPRPNVILIVMDDVGYADYGSYGATDIRTPNIDSLAREGTRFTDFYAAPSCTPTRTALITGRYQQRVGLEVPLGNAGTPTGERGLAATGRSLPRLLKNNGYATALIGKWHLGYEPKFQPNAHGFDYFWGFLSGYVDYYQHTDGRGAHDLFENGKPTHADGYLTDLITAKAVSFIENNARQSFFLEVAFNAAHWPFQLPDKPSVAPGNGRLVQPTDEVTNSRADYAAILERADLGVGNILATLNKLGLARNTLVIFMNDNGGEWLSSNAPLFHRKGTLWEGGVRVPMILRWPGTIPAGRTTSQVGIVMDVTATILRATDTTVPIDARLEGIDLLPVITGKHEPVERTLFFRLSGRQQQSVRQGNWKLLVDGGSPLLFDLSQDPGERTDLTRERPDVVRKLFPLITAWEKDVTSEAGVTAQR